MTTDLYKNENDTFLDCAAIEELKSTATFFPWRLLKNDGAAKPRKVPINVHTGKRADASDPATECTFDQAIAYMLEHGADGLGVLLTDELGIISTDFDDCLDGNGVPEEWIKPILEAPETYTEVSHSGCGIRQFARGRLDHSKKHIGAQCEAYDRARFMAITGKMWPGSPLSINPAPNTIAFIEKRIDSSEKTARSVVPLATKAIIPRHLDNNHYYNVNEAALTNRSMWVPQLFPECVQHGTGYRVPSSALGRPLEEDISIHDSGIKDWGVADQGDPKQGSRTPMDLISEFGGHLRIGLHHHAPDGDPNVDACNLAENQFIAARWLCERMDVDPTQLGYSTESPEAVMHRYNERFSVVMERGKTRVVWFEKDTLADSEREYLVRSSYDDFTKFHADERVRLPGTSASSKNQKTYTYASAPQWWLVQPGRKKHNGVIFDPTGGPVVEGRINLWRGFSVTAKQGDWSRLHRHIEEVIASGNAEHAGSCPLTWCS